MVAFFKKNWLWLAVLILVGLIAGRALFSKELAVTHDLELHAARLANYYLALKQGQLPPRWAPNLNYGFGYPTFIFSYQFPYIFGSILFALTDSVELSLNLLMFISLFAGGVGMFILASLKLKEKQKNWQLQALFIALGYFSAPYILLNVFVRGALGEISFWGLLPWVMIFISLKNFSKNIWYVLLGPIFLWSWFLSHQVLALLALPVLLFSEFVSDGEVKISSFRKNLFFFWLIGLAILMVMFSWLPMVLEKNLVALGYENYQPHAYSEQFPSFWRLIFSKWEYSGLIDRNENGRFTQMIGWPFLLIIGLALFEWWRQKKTTWTKKNGLKNLFFWLVAFFVNLFLMAKWSLWLWQLLPPLQYVQHPWRLLGFSVFASLFVWLEWLLISKNKPAKIAINCFVGLSFLVTTLFWAKPVSTFSKPVEQWLEYHLTGDSYSELTPITFDRGENIAYPEKLYFLDNADQLRSVMPTNLLWTGTHMGYSFETTQAGRIIQKTAYFPGWQVWIDDQPATIEAMEASWSGRITYWVEPGVHQILAIYSDTNTPRQMANKISLLGFGLWFVTLGVVLFRKFSNLR